MKHIYSEVQASITASIIERNRRHMQPDLESVRLFGSESFPHWVFVQIRWLKIYNDGGGGIVTDYLAVGADGVVIEDAGTSDEFGTSEQRMLMFSKLIPIDEPQA